MKSFYSSSLIFRSRTDRNRKRSRSGANPLQTFIGLSMLRGQTTFKQDPSVGIESSKFRCLTNLSPRSDKWNIVVDTGSKTRIGFTVADGSEFMELMRNLVDYHTIIVNYINLP